MIWCHTTEATLPKKSEKHSFLRNVPKKGKKPGFWPPPGGVKNRPFLTLFGGILGGGPDPPVPRLSVRPPYQGGGNVLKQGGGILENRSVLSRGEKRVFFTPKNEGFWPPPGGGCQFHRFRHPGGGVGVNGAWHDRGAHGFYSLRLFFNQAILRFSRIPVLLFSWIYIKLILFLFFINNKGHLIW